MSTFGLKTKNTNKIKGSNIWTFFPNCLKGLCKYTEINLSKCCASNICSCPSFVYGHFLPIYRKKEIKNRIYIKPIFGY